MIVEKKICENSGHGRFFMNLKELSDIPKFPYFRGLVLDDKPLFDKLFSIYPPMISEFTFTNLFIWRDFYKIKISLIDNFLCILSDREKDPFFFPPIGEGDLKKCIQDLFEYLKGRNTLASIQRADERVVSKVEFNGSGINVTPERDQFDYVYLVDDLIKLNGRRYHRKRNHIVRFKENFNFQYTSMTTDLIEECLSLQTHWCNLKHCELDQGLMNESLAIKEALLNYEKLSIRGGVILIDGEVEAFSLGEPLNPDTVVIHIEKANPLFEGIYSVINHAFLEHEWNKYKFVNREQDMGIEGLRKAKESYFPDHMVKKYKICLIFN